MNPKKNMRSISAGCPILLRPSGRWLWATYVYIHRHRTIQGRWYIGAKDADALEGFEKRNAGQGAIVRIET